MKRILWLIVSLAVAAGALVYALSRVDLAQVAHAMAQASYLYILPYVLLLSGYYLLTAFNWRMLLQPLGNFSMRDVLPPMMVGFGGNNLLPARLGELLRTVVFARLHKQPTGAVLASLVLERILDVLSILVVYATSLFFLNDVPGTVATGAKVFAIALIPVALAIAAFLIIPAPFMKLWLLVSAWLPRPIRDRGTNLLAGILHGLTALQSPARLALLAGNSLLKWSCSIGMVWVTLQAFHTGATLGVAMVVLVVSALAIALPNTPGFVGTLQAAFVLGLSAFGVSPDVAFAASVFYLIAAWVPTTVVGIGCAALLGLHFSDLKREVSAAEHAGSPG